MTLGNNSLIDLGPTAQIIRQARITWLDSAADILDHNFLIGNQLRNNGGNINLAPAIRNTGETTLDITH